MAMPRRSPGDFGEIPVRTLLCATVRRLRNVDGWLSFWSGYAWYSSRRVPSLYSDLLTSGVSGTLAEDLFALSYFAISPDRIAKATLWEWHATLKASDCNSPQVRAGTACRWLR